jgi:1,4-alpha-glucan branching enzyme
MSGHLITGGDLHLFNEGTHYRLYDKFGSHLVEDGTYFAVWAPAAERVTVIGDFNGWNNDSHSLAPRENSGVWEAIVPVAPKGSKYKYHIVSRYGGYRVDKADPFAVHAEMPPYTGSIVWDLDYPWGDRQWMSERRERNQLNMPISIYEVHLGSWRRVPEENHRWLSYREMAPQLAEYCRHMGFTHVEFLPVMEHPFYGSWGYQITGYFAPTSRYGTPQDFMYLVDTLHQRGIGVVLDWVPSHFPGDEHGLVYFDGTHLYEHADPRQGFHPDWNSYIFNYGRNEVRSFLLSSATYWLDKYHVDGLRVDAVASMLYLDYSRKPGQWIPNKYGGRENIEAIELLRRFNTDVCHAHGDTFTVAEESTAWPMVSRPAHVGGLGFTAKWDMGWMHDTLDYVSQDPLYRKYHHNQLTFRMMYAFSENFVLPLSHDEVVYGKGSLIRKMPGDDWQKIAGLKLLFAYMYGQPGKKLVFMGGEFGQWSEWNHDSSLEWHLLQHAPHLKVQECVADLNRLYREEPAMHELDSDWAGFEWIDHRDADSSVLVMLRKGRAEDALVIAAYNFTPVPRLNYRVGAPRKGFWREALNTDSLEYAGAGFGNMGGCETVPLPAHGRLNSLTLTLPPLGAVFLKFQGEAPK